MRTIFLILIGLLMWPLLHGGELPEDPSMSTGARSASDSISSTMTLPAVLARVLQASPALAVTALNAEALDGRIHQAGLRPNPVLSTQLENVPGTGDLWFASQTEFTVQMEQQFERGGKRDRRIDLARAERALVIREHEENQADRLAEASQLYVEILAIQNRLMNRRELSGLAERILQIVAERVAAGKVAPVEETRAMVALASARLESDRLQRELVSACNRLAALWGDSSADFEEVAPLTDLIAANKEIPPFQVVSTRNPELLRLEAAEQVRSAELAKETAARTPDITLSAGMRYLNEVRDVALVAGVSMPLPLRDKRQGAIAEAGVRLRQAGAARLAVEQRIRSELDRAQRARDTAKMTASDLEQTILPRALSAFDLLQEGYRQGKTDYLEVLDAQIEAVSEAQRATVESLRLAGSLRELATPHTP